MIAFETGVNAGVDISVTYMRRNFDAILIAAGATVPRDLSVPGRSLPGVHFAMEFLTQQNRRNASGAIPPEKEITAKGKHVVVIGGGDTGSDCVGTSRRQGAASVTQIELLPIPPATRETYNPWPTWPIVMRTSSSHEEGCTRLWSIVTKECVGEGNAVKKLKCAKLSWSEPDGSGRRSFREIPGAEFELQADLVLLAMGFVHVEHGPLVLDLELALDARGNISVGQDGMTSRPGVFAAGDSMLGASLIVRAIDDARRAAEGIKRYLSKKQ
jgi:NADPH-dependent glutamate synthase beta subunit-like oxidoreductase